MLAPSTTGGLRPSKSVREQVTVTEMSATASRSVMKTVLMPGPAADLRDLALDPHRAEPVDPARDRVGDLAHRGRGLERGLHGHAREIRGWRRPHLDWAP